MEIHQGTLTKLVVLPPYTFFPATYPDTFSKHVYFNVWMILKLHYISFSDYAWAIFKQYLQNGFFRDTYCQICHSLCIMLYRSCDYSPRCVQDFNPLDADNLESRSPRPLYALNKRIYAPTAPKELKDYLRGLGGQSNRSKIKYFFAN